jgi:hypothetical protein
MSPEAPLCTRHGQPQIKDKRDRYTGRCKLCMKEDARHRTIARKAKPNPAEEIVNFSDYPGVHQFVKTRAQLNCRTVSQEILYRLLIAMRQTQAGFKAKE